MNIEEQNLRKQFDKIFILNVKFVTSIIIWKEQGVIKLHIQKLYGFN